MRQFNVIFNDFVGEDHPFVGSSDPGGFGFDFYRRHGELFEDLFFELGSDVWFFDMREAEEDPGGDMDTKRKSYFWENGAQSVFDRKGHNLYHFLFIGRDIWIVQHFLY